jgi:hypothetical protein
LFNHKIISSCILFLAGVLATGIVRAQVIEVPVKVQYEILTKVLSFDKKFREHDSNTLTIAILYQKDVTVSEALHNELLEVIQECKEETVQNLKVKFVSLDLSSEKNLRLIISKSNIDVFYIAPLRAYDIRSILKLCSEQHILSASGVREYIDAGVTVGIGTKRNRPQIIINATQAKAEGREFSSRLLKLAKINK